MAKWGCLVLILMFLGISALLYFGLLQTNRGN